MKDILFDNNNKKILSKLAKADLKAHKLKTVLSGTVILIATCLMTVVFTVLINDGLTRSNSTPYHAIYRAIDEDVQSVILSDDDFESAGVYKNFGGTADNSGRTTITYMDSVAMSFFDYTLLDGAYPAKENEVAVSAAYMENHQLSLGDSFTFSYTDLLTNRQLQRQFTVCGVLFNENQDTRKLFTVMVSDNFRIQYAEDQKNAAISAFSTQTPSNVDILLKLNAEKSHLNPEAQEEFLKTKGLALGVESFDIILNHAYINGFMMDTAVLGVLIFFTAFLMFACSYVIYSIFSISVLNSIPMYAQIMSLGATDKQLHRILKYQGNILSAIFVPAGMLLSLLITVRISGTDWLIYDCILAFISGLLIYSVIGVALKKPGKLLTSVSPVEALKNTGVSDIERHRELKHITPTRLAKNNLSINKKKNRMSVVSLSLSGTLMIASAILISSVDLPSMILQSYPLNEDFQVGIEMDNFYERFPQIIQENPLSDELTAQIEALPGVRQVVKDECVIGEIVEPRIDYESADDRAEFINSVSPELLAHAGKVVSGSIDFDDIGTDGIIINQYRVDNTTLNYDDIKTGDTVRFHFDVNGNPVERTFRIIGIAYFPSAELFYTSSDVINSISPFDNVSHLSILCDENYIETVKEGLQSMIGKNPNLTLKSYAEEYSMLENFISISLGSLYGISACIIGFGLLNMINILITGAIVRTREFALLQAVGMTSVQLQSMLYREGLSISVKSSCIAVIGGILMGRLLCYLAYEVMTLQFILFRINPLPLLGFAALLIVVQMIVSFFICKSVERQTLTERLRQA